MPVHDVPVVANCPDKLFTWEEIRKHNLEGDCWVVLYGYVCDMTDFLKSHPGGMNPIRDMGGYDTTNTFEAIAAHAGKERPVKAWQSRVIGRVDPDSKVPAVLRKQVKEKAPVKYSTWGPLFKVVGPILAAIVLYFLLF
jgi:cytochrome b involved in lipid metabolism